jgi:hypothetical protein
MQSFAEWRAELLARVPVTQYPDPRPIPHEMRYTSDDVRWLRGMRIVMPAPMGTLAR